MPTPEQIEAGQRAHARSTTRHGVGQSLGQKHGLPLPPAPEVGESRKHLAQGMLDARDRVDPETGLDPEGYEPAPGEPDWFDDATREILSDGNPFPPVR